MLKRAAFMTALALCAGAPGVGLAAPVTSALKQSATNAIARQLSDPSSLQIEEWRRPRADTICGSYNAKNKFGGYVGFAPFAYVVTKRLLVMLDPDWEVSRDIDKLSGESKSVQLMEMSGCLPDGTFSALTNRIEDIYLAE